MELIFKQDFYKVWACRVGDYVPIWSSDYPTRTNLSGTGESMENAMEWASDWGQCEVEEVAG